MSTSFITPVRSQASQLFRRQQPAWTVKDLFPRWSAATKIEMPCALRKPPQSPRTPTMTVPQLPLASATPASEADEPVTASRPSNDIIADRLAELAMQLGYEMNELKRARKTLLVTSQTELAELEVCVKEVRETLHSYEQDGQRALDLEPQASFKRFDAVVDWFLSRPDALVARDKHGHRTQHAFAKHFLGARTKLGEDEEYRRAALGPCADCMTIEEAQMHAATLSLRIDLLARSIDEATLIAASISDRVALIDKEVEDIKPYGSRDRARKPHTALSLLKARLAKSQASQDDKREAREAAYLAYREIRRAMETRCLAEMREHEVVERITFSSYAVPLALQGHLDANSRKIPFTLTSKED